MRENLGASLRSYVDSKQLFTILDCKMLVQYYCTSCNSKSSCLVDFLASILEYGVESVFPSCFADNADHGSIYCKLRETVPFILPSMGVGRIFSRGANRGISQNFFQGGPKVVKFAFYPSKLKKIPPFRRPCFRASMSQDRLCDLHLA